MAGLRLGRGWCTVRVLADRWLALGAVVVLLGCVWHRVGDAERPVWVSSRLGCYVLPGSCGYVTNGVVLRVVWRTNISERGFEFVPCRVIERF